MRAISEKAKGNLGTLHYYFGSKEALIKKTLERSLRPPIEKCSKRLEAC
jgi:AcrR family transcriptional regulator